MEKKFDKDTLAVEKSNYLSKIVNIYIVYDLDAWPRIPTNNLKFKIAPLEQLVQNKIVIKKVCVQWL